MQICFAWKYLAVKEFKYQSSPLVDAPDALDSPPLGVQEDVSDAACLASMGNLPGESLIAANDNIFGVFQDWVHQNPRIHLDGRIEEDGRWQERC